MRTRLVLLLLCALAALVPAAAPAKGFTRVVLVGSDGRSHEVRASETRIDGLLSRRGSAAAARGGYVRLFFVGAGDFPANPARYYPDVPCVALDWPTYERACARVSLALARLLRRSAGLRRFSSRPTVLVQVTYRGAFSGVLSALRGPVELALDRSGRAAPQPRRCYAFGSRWRGPAAPFRPRRFLLCAEGVYTAGRLHPLGRGVWRWFRLNVGFPAR